MILAVDRFTYNSITQQLVHSGTNTCVSVWHRLAADPANVNYVPGLIITAHHGTKLFSCSINNPSSKYNVIYIIS